MKVGYKEVSYPDLGIVFVWHGGAYIDICTMGRSRKAFEVINVWDYVSDQATIPFTTSALRQEANRWIRENKADLPNYFESVRYI